jgi:hypothetical protein
MVLSVRSGDTRIRRQYVYTGDFVNICPNASHRAIEGMKRLVEKYRGGFEKYLENEVGNGSGLN